MNPNKMRRPEWNKTPYATSKCRDPDKSITDLFRKYKIHEYQFGTCYGPNKRKMFGVWFKFKDKAYRVELESVNADVDPELLFKQVKRAVYFYLKSALEYASVFTPLEQVLFAHLATDGGETLYETIGRITGGTYTNMKALGPATTKPEPPPEIVVLS